MKVVGTNISMTRGDSETITISCWDEDNIFIPLVSGEIIFFTVKENTSTTTIIIQKIINIFTDGKAIIEIVPSDTHELKYKQYVYDVQLVRPINIVTTIIVPSKFTITDEVTYE